MFQCLSMVARRTSRRQRQRIHTSDISRHQRVFLPPAINIADCDMAFSPPEINIAGGDIHIASGEKTSDNIAGDLSLEISLEISLVCSGLKSRAAQSP